MTPLLPFLFALQAAGVDRLPSDSGLVHANGKVPPAVIAIRVDRPPILDGRLDDDAWQAAVPVSGFRRDVPSDGLPAAEASEVRVVFDDRALYVGARLYARDATTVSRRLGRRDSFGVLNDRFFVMLDSHHDHRTAFVFGVTPEGERDDARVSDDDRASLDTSWDPVWAARTLIDSLGWVAELRIPLSQLRFSSESHHAWGIQFRRDILSAGEAVDWAWTSASEPGWPSKFGHLLGLEDLQAPRRLEILPYVSSTASYAEGADPQNPFDDGSTYEPSVGLDLKYGVSSDFTLDLSINPDFGQVDADPAVVNLTNFETFFPELRPLFIEGSDILSFGIPGHQVIYSRRIGRAPQRSVLGMAEYVDQPQATTILGAAKFSGKTQSGWSVGVLDAVTAEEHARMATSPTERLPSQPVEPWTNYTVARVKKDLRGGSSQFGFAATGVHRDGSEDALSFLNSSAYSGGVDFVHRFAQNAFSVTGLLAFSHIRGGPGAIDFVQRSSAHYFQRPDQDHVTLDAAATTMTGTFGLFEFSENAGNWVFSTFAAYSSPGYEINDAGFQGTADHRVVAGSVTRRWVQPGKVFRSASLGTSANVLDDNFGGRNRGRTASLQFQGQLHNLWNLGANVAVRFRGINDRETRGGPLIERPGGVRTSVSVSGDSRSVVSFGGQLGFDRDVAGSWAVDLRPRVLLSTSGRLRAEITPRYRRSFAEAFYVTQTVDSIAVATFGGRYAFAELDQSSLDITLRVDLAMTRNMTLQLYAQPLVASGEYEGFKELAAPSSFDFIDYDGPTATIAFDAEQNVYTADADGTGPGAPLTFPNPDFTIRSLRTNLVFRWEHMPGSTIFVAWSQNRFTRLTDPSLRVLGQFGDLFGDNMLNVLQVKMNYWLNW